MTERQTTSPEALTVKAVNDWLLANGATHIIKTKELANILRCSERSISNAVRNKKLIAIDTRTFLLCDVAKWLISEPRRIASISIS
jgi:DNA-binding CsgD family transcriptional regulator